MQIRSLRRLLFATAALTAIVGAADAATITLKQISTTFNSPIGIDYHEPTDSVIMSVNYNSGGQPHNLERVQADGTHVQYSNLSGLTDELKIATVRSGNAGGFTTGDVFTGTGQDGVIARVSNGGGTVETSWVSLPGNNNGLIRGSLYVDRSGAFGGDLIVVTTAGQVWRVKSDGTTTATPLASLNTHLEGLLTVPNDPRYGILAGKIIIGAEDQNRLYIVGADGSTSFINIGIPIEDLDFITGTENFFGVNFGTGKLLGAAASDFAAFAGEILITSEFGGATSGLWHLRWDGTQLVAEEFLLSANSASRGQWEHVTFAPSGIVEIPPVGAVPAPASILLLGAALAGLGLARRRD